MNAMECECLPAKSLHAFYSLILTVGHILPIVFDDVINLLVISLTFEGY